MTQTILTLDTATEAFSVALWHNHTINEIFEMAPRQHAEIILARIDALLSQAGITLTAVDAVAFGAGPGSFMGVRLATAVAQGLAFALNKPVIPISTLQILAQTAYQKTGIQRVLAGWDARLDAIYWGAYQLDENKIMQPIIADQLSSPESLPLPVWCQDNNAWLAAGNAWSVYATQFPLDLQTQLVTKQELLYPRAGALVAIAVAAYLQGKTIPALKAEPIYLRNQVAWKK